MGIRIYTESEDLGQLTQRVDRVRLHLEQAVAQLAEVMRRIPATGTVRRALLPTGPDVRHELSNACTSLELALADTLKWANKVAATTTGKPERTAAGRS